MSAIELVTKIIGNVAGKEVREPTGNIGNSFTDTNVWLSQKISAGIKVKNVTLEVIVANNHGKGWAAFDEPQKGNTLRTIFEIS